MASCSKDHSTPTPSIKPLATLGLYEVDTSIYKRIFIPISGMGTASIQTYYLVFDTGSSGLTIDAHGILPASMVTGSGITVTGDSVVVNGITVTNQTAILSYGNASSSSSEYGNVAYATVKIGDSNGAITTGRIPIFLYYKIVDNNGAVQAAHSQDIFGVGPGTSFASTAIGSPLSYFKTTNGLLNGYKLSKLVNADFSTSGNYVQNLLQIGLLPSDVNPSNGFIMHQLTYFNQGGYSPDIASTVSYNGNTVSASVLFDTGTPAISIVENKNAPGNIATIPANTNITLTTNNGFTYNYTTSSGDNITDVANPSYTGDPRTIFSINFFTDNEFIMDYQGHEIGLKNN
ncbi:MAG TPA: hypothetical protein VFE53_05900 [Mucilaginibacter sp.]|jgi:hypothetical protein|nr:hypothetical protein [Mucilaginibacter sp.]